MGLLRYFSVQYKEFAYKIKLKYNSSVLWWQSCHIEDQSSCTNHAGGWWFRLQFAPNFMFCSLNWNFDTIFVLWFVERFKLYQIIKFCWLLCNDARLTYHSSSEIVSHEKSYLSPWNIGYNFSLVYHKHSSDLFPADILGFSAHIREDCVQFWQSAIPLIGVSLGFDMPNSIAIFQ